MDAWLPAVFGLGGVVLGTILASMFELFRRALEAQSAARVLRVETIDNRSKAEELIAGRPVRSGFESMAWQTLRLNVAPFLDELQLMRLAQSYAEMRDFQLVQAPMTRFLLLDVRDKELVERWLDRMRDQARWLRSVEAANPWLLSATQLARKRMATPAQIRSEYSISEEEIRARQEESDRRRARLAGQEGKTTRGSPP